MLYTINPVAKAKHEVAVKICGAEGVPTILILLWGFALIFFFNDSFMMTSFLLLFSLKR